MKITPGMYRAFTMVALPLASLYLMWRSRKQPAYRDFWDERFAWSSYPPKGEKPRVWLHAVSVGETNAAKPLLETMLKAWPECDVLLTHMTPTGREAGRALVDLAPEGGMEAVMLEQYGEGVATETVEANGLWYGGGLAAKDLTQFSMTSTDNKIVTRGWMDIQNRTSIYRVDMVEPGMFYAFTLELQPMDYTVKAGHKLALVLYSVDPEVTYWPEAVTNFTVDNTGTYVTIPVR